MKGNIYKRLSAVFLAMVMLLSIMPAALADEPTGVDVEGIELSITDPPGGSLEIQEQDTAAIQAVIKVNEEIAPIATNYIQYRSSDETVAEVSGNGGTATVTGIKDGTAVITAFFTSKAGNYYAADCTVTVKKNIPVSNVTISVQQTILEVSNTITANAVVSPSDATEKTLTWTSSKPEVVSVNSAGELKALAPGKAEITASADGVTSNTVEVHVSGVAISPETLSLLVGKSDTLSFGRYGSVETATLTWSTSNPSVAGVKEGVVTGYYPGTAVITAKSGSYSASCTVTVKEDVADAIPKEMTAGEVLSFSDLMSALNNRAITKLGTGLEYITNVSVATGSGILYYGYTSPDAPGSGVGGSEKYYVSAGASQRRISDISFVPKPDFGGTAVISYTGYGEGNSFTGTIRVQVENSGDVAYNTAEGRLLQFEAADFSTVCKTKTGTSLRYVTFSLPSANRGTLYYDYSSTGQYSQKVTSGTKYYVVGSSLLLENVSFLPAEGYTGTVEIPYHGTDSSGRTYAGTVTITVFAANNGSSDDIVYETSGTTPVSFQVSDFNAACVDATNSNLNYVYFDLPESGDGTLYYNYVSSSNYGSKVDQNTRYFRNSSPRIAYVDFVPASGLNRTVTISYTGYSTAGEQFKGTVRIRVGADGGTISYTTDAGRAVDLNGLDFNEACQASNGTGLRAVRFDLPSSLEGTLYSGYKNSNSKGTKVKEGTSYSVSALSNITFVPYTGFTGTVYIPYSGYDNQNGRVSGEVKITVTNTVAEDIIRYNVARGGAVIFNAADFNQISKLMTGANLSYVRFAIPASKYGKLYYKYNESKDTGTTVSASNSYYRTGGSRLLDDVSFVAADGYSGVVEISYTGRSTGGENFEGIISITVSEPVVPVVYYTGSSLPVQFKAADFRSACADGLSKTLSYITFESLPGSIYGKLMVTDSATGKDSVATVGSKYYNLGTPGIDMLSFVAKAGFQGSVTIPYTAVDLNGNSMSGTVRIIISNSYLDAYFKDLGSYSWAAPSIEYLRSRDVTYGYGNGKFGPGDNISRGQFVAMLCRLFEFEPQYSTSFPDVPAGSYYAQAVMTAKALGIVTGDGGNFNPNGLLTRQQAVVMIERAARAAGMNVTGASASLLDAYNDGGTVAGYAKNAMAAMIKMGVIGGDTGGNLNPGRAITRAEMAVMLHRVATV